MMRTHPMAALALALAAAIMSRDAHAQDACSGRINMWVASQASGGLVTVNGVAPRRPKRTPFAWDWGDGASTTGWFPQRHRYSLGPARRAFTISLAAHEDDGAADCAELAVCFGTGRLKIWVEAQRGDAVRINGVDPRQPTRTSFTWIWGDGARTLGWFPQSHAYPAGVRPRTVTVVATEDDGTSDCSQLTLRR